MSTEKHAHPVYKHTLEYTAGNLAWNKYNANSCKIMLNPFPLAVFLDDSVSISGLVEYLMGFT